MSCLEEKALAFQELEYHGYGGSITGSTFSSLHGDLLTELFNKETKGTAGPIRSGFSTNTAAVNTLVLYTANFARDSDNCLQR